MTSTAQSSWLGVFRRYLVVMALGNLAWEFTHMPLYTLWDTGSTDEIVFAALHWATNLTEDERTSLLSLIDQRISRQPEEKVGYDALRFLAEAGLTGAAELMAAILLNRPLDKVPATVGMDVTNLLNAKSELHSILDPVRDHLSRSKTAIGRAAQSAKPTTRK